MDTTTRARTAVVIPAYEPGAELVRSTRELIGAGFTVVVVDDGSGPSYGEVISQLDPGIHLLTHARNRGKGAALETGYRYVQAEIGPCTVVTADADGQQTVADIARIAAAGAAHPGKLLLGSRTFDGADVPPRSRVGNRLTSRAFGMITRRPVNDTQTGLRAFDSSMIDFMLRVPGDRFDYEMNVLLACTREGIPLVELPIETVYQAGNPTSHFRPIRDSVAVYRQILLFAASSLLAFALDTALFAALVWATGDWPAAASITFANVLARLVSATVNFTVNRYLVFGGPGEARSRLLKYVLLAVAVLVGNTLLLNVLVAVGLPALPAKIVTELTLWAVSYLAQRYLVFAAARERRAS